jgi:GntR family transcriptional repressor for pyruvate dehydrogenase complex
VAVTDEAILRIKGMILDGELHPGDRLPSEKELSERLGLSRNSMREAIKVLEGMNVLDVRRGDGTYVTSLEPRLLLEALSFIVDLHDNESVVELFAVRRILEPAAASMAAGKLTPKDIANLRAQVASVARSVDLENLVAHDIEFHATIVEAAGNGYLATLVQSMSGPTTRARIWRGLTENDAANRTIAEHSAIVDALELGDARLAETLTAAHIYGIERWLQLWVHGTPAPTD